LWVRFLRKVKIKSPLNAPLIFDLTRQCFSSITDDERDLLDQQVIDVHGRKVVRVKDVDLAVRTESKVTTKTH